MLIPVIVNSKDPETLLSTARQILADEECENQCMDCPIVWCCGGPEQIPFNLLKIFIKQNVTLRVEDDKLNGDIKFENMSGLNRGDYAYKSTYIKKGDRLCIDQKQK